MRKPASPAEILRAPKRGGTQIALYLLRGVVDLTFDRLSVDPRSGDLVIGGLTFYPLLDWDSEGTCAITFGTLVYGSGSSLDTPFNRSDIPPMRVPSVCLPPEQGAVLQSFGDPELLVEHATAEIRYDLASTRAETTANRNSGRAALC
ncbi:MAG: hypothetical protein AAGG06_08995 [Pseudomonadota bacterium]